MRRLWILPVLLALVGALPAAVRAQPPGAPANPALEQAIDRFRAGDHRAAARLFEEATRARPDDARAHFLLGRVLADTVLNERGRALQEMDRASRLDPDNLEYLVARLVLLRDDAPTFIQDRLREQRRVEIAQRLLRVDSTNAFAHEELGRFAIRDFLRYRNALMLPQLDVMRTGGGRWDEGTSGIVSFEDNPFNPTGTGNLANVAQASNTDAIQGLSSVFRADRFNLDVLRQQGVPFMNLAGRAESAYRGAVVHLKSALDVDPLRRKVYDDLMTLYTLKGEWGDALETLQGMYSYFPEDPETWFYLGLAHQRAGNADAADRAFATGLRFADAEVRAAYGSVSVLLDEHDRALAAQDPDGFAARYWTAADPRLLTTYNERHLEHYARLTQAELLYSVPALRKHGWQTQRGSIIVRYGPPKTDVMVYQQQFSQAVQRNSRDAGNAQATLTQAQQQADLTSGAEVTGGGLVRAGDRNDIQVERDRRRNDLSFSDALNTFNIWDYGTFRFVFEDPLRNGEYRLYSPSSFEISDGGADPWVDDYQIVAQRTFARTPQTYTYETSARQVELPYLVSTFRGQRGNTDVYVHYGVPVGEVPAGAEQLNVNAQTGAFLVSNNHDILFEQRQTLYGMRTAQIVRFEDANLWVNTQTMAVRPGPAELSVEFQTASGSTVAVQRRAVDVPNYSEGAFRLSDLMLAYRAERTPDGRPLEGGEIVRNGLSIRPAPWSVFRRDQRIYLYFELYDLAVGAEGRTDYDVELTLSPKDRDTGLGGRIARLMGRRSAAVSVKYPGGGTLRTVENATSLDASREKPGLYTLTLVVQDKAGRRTQEKSVDLFLE